MATQNGPHDEWTRARRADEARARARLAAERARSIGERIAELRAAAVAGWLQGSTPEQVQKAGEHADEAARHAERARLSALAQRARTTAPHRPEAHRPDTHGPEGHRPDAHRPDAHRPDAHRPDAHRPDAHRPDAHSPEARRAGEAPQRADEPRQE
ncbi:hypothetical protein MF672_000480 [Actinomadura sp. ATCC 31491]|uniref:Uncharacterized protein n=1 Tax=Actinomadura luzonensis TaxID=2805427 RepID=A0ABT0FJP3_9ACTN|nr:hypothetical protein [Actinomadura luzonensis]MCK2212280.1 hypothetical protein [Actinomadura luzonensis]